MRAIRRLIKQWVYALERKAAKASLRAAQRRMLLRNPPHSQHAARQARYLEALAERDEARAARYKWLAGVLGRLA